MRMFRLIPIGHCTAVIFYVRYLLEENFLFYIQACWEVSPDYYVSMTYICYHHKIIPENYFSLSSNGLLRYFDRCVGSVRVPYLTLVECPSTQTAYSKWELKRRGVVWGSLVYHHITDDGTLEEWCIAQVSNSPCSCYANNIVE
jgi:hypothetical protein